MINGGLQQAAGQAWREPRREQATVERRFEDLLGELGIIPYQPGRFGESSVALSVVMMMTDGPRLRRRATGSVL